MEELVVVPGSSNGPLAYRLAKELKAPLVPIEIKKFPDGEKYVRILDDISGKRVVILQSAAIRPDEYLVETLLIADALNDLGAREVILALAYFPYARQDERFKPGEAVSLVTVGKLLRAVGVDMLITVDAHRHRVVDFGSIFGGKVIDVSVMPYLARYAIENGLISKEAVVIGPDAEAEGWAKLAAEAINAAGHASLRKKRISPTEVEVTISKPLEVKETLLVDDIISTGGTVIEATRLLRNLGAEKVVVACTHGLFVEDALVRIYKEGVEAVISSDTVPNQTTRVSAARAIASALKV